MNKPLIGRDTRLCMSLSARPGNFGTRFHNRLYELLGLDYVYKAFSTQDLAGVVRGIRALNIRGCAVSMPFKEDVIPLLDALEGSAAAIDSVKQPEPGTELENTLAALLRTFIAGLKE